MTQPEGNPMFPLPPYTLSTGKKSLPMGLRRSFRPC